CCVSRRRAGCCSCRRCSRRANTRRCSSTPAGPHGSACCGNSLKRWKRSRWCGPVSWCWRICTGVIPPRSSGWHTWLRARGPARLLVLGTYRPVETIVRAHPVRAMVQALLVHGEGTELALEEWSEAGVAAYLAQRGAGVEVPAALARVLTQRTDGHPLFVVA